MLNYLSPNEFLTASSSGVILDVRSPGEFDKGHIPGAISFPLFSNAERAQVGTLYKQTGKNEALLKGLELIGPKLRSFAEEAMALSQGKPVFIHCWRGGMRSAGMATLLQTAGMKCFVLKGGYKNYRNFILEAFKKPWKFIVLGGKTGSGKTLILHALATKCEQVLDMEALANHKGSAFGRIGELPQPGTEQFGNMVYEVLSKFDSNKTVWIEDESHTIGSVFIPSELYNNYRNCPLLVLDIPFEERVKHLSKIYGNYDKEDLKAAFERIRKKLGGQHVKTAFELIDSDDAAAAASIALHYYDKAYLHGLQNKDTKDIQYFAYDILDTLEISEALLKINFNGNN